MQKTENGKRKKRKMEKTENGKKKENVFVHGCVVTSHYWSLVTIGQGRTPQGRCEEWVRLGHLITIDHMTTILLCHWFNSLLKH